MKHIYLMGFLAMLPVMSSAQNKIGYSYDAAGNRVKREIVMSYQQAMSKQQTFPIEEPSFSDNLQGHSVKIYPNPTEGVLKISIIGLKDSEDCSLEVCTSQGIQIMTEKVRTDNIFLNISNQPAGIYLLSITINKNSTTWKIIKK